MHNLKIVGNVNYFNTARSISELDIISKVDCVVTLPGRPCRPLLGSTVSPPL